MKIILILAYSPRGRISDIGNQDFNPLLNLIGCIIVIFYFWYTENLDITKALYEPDMYSRPSRRKMKNISWGKRLLIIGRFMINDIKKLIIYIKENLLISIIFIVVISYVIISWFT